MNKHIQEMLESLSQERLMISKIEKMIEKAGVSSPEMTLAGRKAQMAKMMLGKAKGIIGGPNPYPQSKNPEVKSIAPPANDFEYKEKLEMDKDPVVNIMAARKELKEVDRLLQSDMALNTSNETYHFVIKMAYANVLESGFYLGLELGAIKAKEDKEAAKKAAEKKKAAKEQKEKEIAELLNKLKAAKIEIPKNKVNNLKFLKAEVAKLKK